jgi:hypothetical protein
MNKFIIKPRVPVKVEEQEDNPGKGLSSGGSVYRWLRLRDDAKALRGGHPEPGNNTSCCFTEMNISRQQTACTMLSRIQETGYLPVSQHNICVKPWEKAFCSI